MLSVENDRANRIEDRLVSLPFPLRKKIIIFHAFFNLVFPSNFESVCTDI